MSGKRFLVGLGLLLALIVAIGSRAAAQQHEHAKKANPTALDAFKRLTGQWKGKMDMHGEKVDAITTYRVTSGGSAVMETDFAGSDHEMVTLYHLDGNDLVLTHYCMLGNQPHMKAVAGDDPKKVVFKFAGGSNIKPESDMHMHDATFEFVDDDHFTSTWTLYQNGKVASVHKIELERVKK